MKRLIPYFLVLFALITITALTIAMNSGGSTNMQSKDRQAQTMSTDEFLKDANIGTKDVMSQNDTLKIEIDDFLFKTTTASIPTGTTVTWTNIGKVRHNVVSDESSPKKGLESNLLAHGDSYSYTFTAPGTYYYLCTPHPTLMRGVIVVR